jgi:hypothetical protein
VSQHIFMILMDVPTEREEAFNRLYDTDHLPHMMQVPAVRRCDRYRLNWSDNADMQRYLALYAIDDPEAPASAAWKAQAALGAWATEMRPHILSRRNGVFAPVSAHGTAPAGDGFGPTIYFLQQGIPAAHEDRFNALYEGSHIPYMMQVPGVAGVSRFRLVASESGGVPDYLAIYTIGDARLPKSPDWQAQTAKGPWQTEMRPHFTARRNGAFERISSFVD